MRPDTAVDVPAELARLALFAGLDTADRAVLADATATRALDAGETVFTRLTPADACYAVVAGTVELAVSSPTGRRKVVETIRAGQTFGEAVMFLRRRFPVDAVAVEPATVLRVPASAVDHLLESRPGAARAMLASLSVRLHSLVHDVEMYTVQPARERVAGYLLDHADPDGVVRFSPSKAAVASRLAMTPETLSRVLRELVDGGAVRVDGRVARVLDADALT